MKNTKGITLVALVITVIVMLILAGVVIHLSIGENGIFKKASQGANIYEEVAKKEQSDLENLYSQIRVAQDSQVTLTMEQLNEYINNKVDEKLNDVKNTMVSKEEYEQMQKTIGQIRSGTVKVGVVSASGNKYTSVTFKEPVASDQYSVTLTYTTNAKYYASIGYAVMSKTVNGFQIAVYNNAGGSSGEIAFQYIAVPYTE